MKHDNLIKRDHQHIWHPCSQMKDYEVFKPLHIVSAKGCYLELKDGKRVIDAISSWWCKSLGHQHPRLKQALLKQMEKFEHVILANTTHEGIVELSLKLSRLIPSLNKIFYASDGSSAIEIALKMSLHARQLQGEKRTLFVALENGYHGETVGALSVSDLGLYRAPYTPLLFESHFIASLPYVFSTEDPLWKDCSSHWMEIEKKLIPLAHQITAIIVEPIVQGAGGMKIYSQDFLRRLWKFTKQNHIHLIADEMMTGLGRTGRILACHYAEIEPDFLGLSKGLTGGFLPFSAILTTQAIYDLFYDDYQTGKSFLHSHTYSGNALAAAVALEVLNVIEEENICKQAEEVGKVMLQGMREIAEKTGRLENIRGIGAMVAADLVTKEKTKRIGFEVYQKATELGALLRPLGNTIYWLPPLNISMETLAELKEITKQAIVSVSYS